MESIFCRLFSSARRIWTVQVVVVAVVVVPDVVVSIGNAEWRNLHHLLLHLLLPPLPRPLDNEEICEAN